MAQYRLIICDLQFRLACMNICRTICINGDITICRPNIAIFIDSKRTLRRRKITIFSYFSSINRCKTIIFIVTYKTNFNAVICCNVASQSYAVTVNDDTITTIV